jgi:uncharacterized protein YbjQ (UPF0145 family)
MTLDAKLASRLERNVTADVVIECTWGNRPAAVGFEEYRVAVVGTGRGREIVAPYPSVTVVDGTGPTRRVRCYGMEPTLTFADEQTAERFDAVLAARRPAVVPAGGRVTTPAGLPLDRVTTLQTLPGHRIVRVLGPVTELGSTSRWAVNFEGADPIAEAMTALRRRAAAMGAGAVVGLTSDASPGLARAFSGQPTLSVLLVGTAVLVEPVEAEPSAGPS